MLKSPITYYRALLRYRELTQKNKACLSLREPLATNDTENDKLVITRSFCDVDEEWLIRIEQGLIPVSKAIAQDRQFIRSNGEVLPIERVKHISKESVEHLSRHSDMITRRQTGDTLIPDKLYTVERLNDYAVYENRFLYALLTYLRDFIEFRYNEILEISNRYDAKIDIKKSFTIANQTVEYTLTMQDTRKNDPYLVANNESSHILRRIHNVRKSVANLLATPLMEAMAKAPLLKPPITKTNVLRMNTDFKGAVELYDFLLSYTEKGFSVRSGVKLFSPFPRVLADEMAEAGCLVASLGYRYGLDLTDEIRAAIAKEDSEERLKRATAAATRIAALRKKLSAQEITLEEYFLSLEEEIRKTQNALTEALALHEQATALAAALTEEGERKDKLIAELTERVTALEKTLIELKEAHARELERVEAAHREEIERLKVAHEAELQALRAAHAAEIATLNAEHEAEITELKTAHETEIYEVKTGYNAELEAQKAAEEARVAALNEAHTAALRAKENERAAMEEALHATEEMLTECRTALKTEQETGNALRDELRVRNARIKALGGLEGDCTDRESFGRLEEEYHAFTRLYREQWAKAKRAIRKKHLNAENIRGNSSRTDGSDNDTTNEEA